MTEHVILELPLRRGDDPLLARQRVLRLSQVLRFGRVEQTRIATAMSELARACVHAAGGTMRVLLRTEDEAGRLRFEVHSSDPIAASAIGPLVPRLMDGFAVRPEGSGSLLVLETRLPVPVAATEVAALRDAVRKSMPVDHEQELQQRQDELLLVLNDLQQRQHELQAANRELEDTNRGVLALYSELDEHADQLKRANQLKGQFLSYLSHEFRTPLNSMVMLARMMLDEMGGPITEEQGTQLRLMRKSAEDLLDMVNDLLDLAKIDAGKIDLHADVVDVPEFFSALRGMMRPLAMTGRVELIFENPAGIPLLRTDSGKLAQVLRNLVSNALKFTNEGEVRVSAEAGDEFIHFVVKDTGIGIPEDARERIFGDFEQVPTAIHRRVRGTGLGLPLSQRLARLLGGEISLESETGAGSTFTLRLPVTAPFATEAATAAAEAHARGNDGLFAPPEPAAPPPDLTGRSVLVIDDDAASRYLVRALLQPMGAAVLEADNGMSGLDYAVRERPALILLDLRMPGMDGHEVLDALAADEATRGLPVIIYTSKRLQDEERQELRRRTAAVVVKNPDQQRALIAAIRSALAA